MPISKQQREFYKQFSRHGSGDAIVQISAKDVALLIHIAVIYLHGKIYDWMLPRYVKIANKDFFEISPKDIEILDESS